MARPLPSLNKRFSQLTVPPGSVALAPLGQAGFLLKSPRGITAALDPYLSNSCEGIGQSIGVNMRRSFAPPLKPRDLVPFDILLFSHSHQDHVDPETIQPYLAAGGKGRVVAPHEAADRLRSLGVPARQISLTWPNHTHTFGDLTVKTTFAIPFGGDDLTHVGYLVDVRDGPRLYFTGDTDYNDILHLAVAPYQPDTMITVINPAFRNLGPAEAARLAAAIKPKRVIPCHHDLFPDNSLPARLLHTNLAVLSLSETFLPLVPGKIQIIQDHAERIPLIPKKS